MRRARPPASTISGDAPALGGTDSTRPYFLFRAVETLHARGVPASVVASVVFLRIQDFARRPASEQTRMRAQLEAVVAVTAAELEPVTRVVLEAPDGAVIVGLHDAKGAPRLPPRAPTAAALRLPRCAGLYHRP